MGYALALSRLSIPFDYLYHRLTPRQADEMCRDIESFAADDPEPFGDVSV